ncbi:MAG: ChbG/HpnK family deacetylase [Alphaproteobacteria bacterium]|nr:ChbG/HpnK family deacetylase [Alphaproteobacteria bacterium]
MPPVPFILIADDYGLTEGVSRAILSLLASGRISGTSSMTNQGGWPELAKNLAPYHGKAELGLHLTLTLGRPLGPMPLLAPTGELPTLGQILKASLLGNLSKREISAEITCQIAEFEAQTGRLPDFIDGHQHVHIMPTIRSALWEAIEQYRPGWRPWLRNPADHLGAIMARGVSVGKSLFIAFLAQGFAVSAKKRGFLINDSFSGVSDFDPKGDFAGDFRRYLLVSGERHLVMCHPGHSDAALAGLDPVTRARDIEFEFLQSEAFARLLASMNMEISRFPKG